ncbi:hypothetical protein CF392_08455 [Tamilnaduibacter salinus]|uniref:Uncharacterized protein n=1 Tax=Tamilnaduibacter salinus TaxID=1484056 RepID=A0A2A2I3Q7_9GAMM|nr:hypothetical protein CF392_08455 [Tamilnaduibacter salinus]
MLPSILFPGGVQRSVTDAIIDPDLFPPSATLLPEATSLLEATPLPEATLPTAVSVVPGSLQAASRKAVAKKMVLAIRRFERIADMLMAPLNDGCQRDNPGACASLLQMTAYYADTQLCRNQSSRSITGP